jgi:DNA-binding NarL/FixJ family response regulator
VHWPRTQCEALNLATSAAMHMGVVDQSLPDEGGLGLVRAFRRLGLDFPCLLICDGADPRLLRQALELDIFSVISVETAAPAIWPMVVRALQRHYQLPWNGEGSVN